MGERLGDLEEGEIAGFDSESRTLLASNMASDTLLQVTPTEARLVSCGTLQCLSVWSAAAGTINLKIVFSGEDVARIVLFPVESDGGEAAVEVAPATPAAATKQCVGCCEAGRQHEADVGRRRVDG